MESQIHIRNNPSIKRSEQSSVVFIPPRRGDRIQQHKAAGHFRTHLGRNLAARSSRDAATDDMSMAERGKSPSTGSFNADRMGKFLVKGLRQHNLLTQQRGLTMDLKMKMSDCHRARQRNWGGLNSRVAGGQTMSSLIYPNPAGADHKVKQKVTAFGGTLLAVARQRRELV